MARRRQQVDIHGSDKSKGAFASLQASARRTTRVFAGVGGALKSAFLPLAGAAGGVALIRQTASAMNELDLIGKKARTSGLSTDAFQALGVAAEEANVSSGLLNSSLVAFVKRVGEAKAGMGPLVSGLKTLDGELLKSITSAGNQEDALRQLVAGYQAAETATDKARITNAAFGRSGIEVGRVLEQLTGGFDEYTKRAKELGLVYDRDLIANQERLNNDLGIFNKVIGVQFKSILVTLAPILVKIAAQTAEWAKSLRSLFDVAGGAGLSRINTLKTRINEINTALASGPFSQPGAGRNALLAELERKTDELKTATAAMRAIEQSVNRGGKTDFGGGFSGSASGIANLRTASGSSGGAASVTNSASLKAANDQAKALAERLKMLEQIQRQGQQSAQQWGSALGGFLNELTAGADDATKAMIGLVSEFTKLAALANQNGGQISGGGGGSPFDVFNAVLSGFGGGGGLITR